MAGAQRLQATFYHLQHNNGYSCIWVWVHLPSKPPWLLSCMKKVILKIMNQRFFISM